MKENRWQQLKYRNRLTQYKTLCLICIEFHLWISLNSDCTGMFIRSFAVTIALPMAHKAFPAVIKCCMIPFWMLGNLFAFITSCEAPWNHLSNNCNLLCWIPQKIDGEAGREGCKQKGCWILNPFYQHAKGFPLPFFRRGEILWCMGEKDCKSN